MTAKKKASRKKPSTKAQDSPKAPEAVTPEMLLNVINREREETSRLLSDQAAQFGQVVQDLNRRLSNHEDRSVLQDTRVERVSEDLAQLKAAVASESSQPSLPGGRS